jgi:hypothetical protein
MMTYSFTSQEDLDELTPAIPVVNDDEVSEDLCEGFCYRCLRPTNDFDEGGYYVCGAHS